MILRGSVVYGEGIQNYLNDAGHQTSACVDQFLGIR